MVCVCRTMTNMTADEAIEMCIKVFEAGVREVMIGAAARGQLSCSAIEPETAAAVNRFKARIDRAKLEDRAAHMIY